MKFNQQSRVKLFCLFLVAQPLICRLLASQYRAETSRHMSNDTIFSRAREKIKKFDTERPFLLLIIPVSQSDALCLLVESHEVCVFSLTNVPSVYTYSCIQARKSLLEKNSCQRKNTKTTVSLPPIGICRTFPQQSKALKCN
jgi:hypothetical protein